MKGKMKDKTRVQTPKGLCPHYWVIEVANGPVSRGQCKYCGAKQDFFNFFPGDKLVKKGADPWKLPKLNAAEDGENSQSLITR